MSMHGKAIFVPTDGGLTDVDGVKGNYVMFDSIDLDQAKRVIENLVTALDKLTETGDRA
jgi:hypothetical protein